MSTSPSNYVLLDNPQDLPSPEPLPQTSRWKGRLWTAVTVGAAAGCVAWELANYSNVSNALASLSAGIFGQMAIQSIFQGTSLQRAMHVTSTLFGQVSAFDLSQGYANATSRKVQIGLTQSIIALFGANIAVALTRLYQEQGVRVEHTSSSEGAKMNYKPLIPSVVAHVLKIAATGACIAAANMIFPNDRISQGFSYFFAAVYGAQLLGTACSTGIDREIENRDIRPGTLSEVHGTKWRTAKTCVNTAGYVLRVASLAGLIPIPLWGAGIVLGFFSGFTGQGEMRRIHKLSEAELSEFIKLDPPESTQSGCGYAAYKVWRYAVPFFSFVSVVGVTSWLLSLPDNDINSYIAMGSMLSCFIPTYLWAKYSDEKLALNGSKGFLNWSLVHFWASFRILGIDPLYLYYAGTQVLKLDSQATVSLQDSYYKGITFAAWGAYGVSMACELMKTTSERMGSATLMVPLMMLVNGMLTTDAAVKGNA
ncbi:MAG: hypothetical protein WCF19_03615 [Chlamydiales bacterium]